TDPELDARIADLGAELGALATRVETVDASVASGWSAASQAAASLDHRLTTLAEQVEAARDPEAEGRLEALAEELTALGTRFADVESQTTGGWGEATSAIASLDHRLTALAETLGNADADADTTDVRAEVDVLRSEIGGVAARLDDAS